MYISAIVDRVNWKIFKNPNLFNCYRSAIADGGKLKNISKNPKFYYNFAIVDGGKVKNISKIPN